jgi:hypothetical protein
MAKKIHFHCKLQGHARNNIDFLTAIGGITKYKLQCFSYTTAASLCLF